MKLNKTPGLLHTIDPTLTIKAPYSQGIMNFGENAGEQYVATSLIALIYNKIKEILIILFLLDISLRHASFGMHISQMLFLEPLRTASDQHA